MAAVYLKLAFAGARRRLLQTALTALVVAAAAAGLTVALGIDRVAERPWERTFEATNGPHVTVVGPPGVDLAPVAARPGVVASTGVLPRVDTTFARDGKTFNLALIGVRRDSEVARPIYEDGSYPAPGEVALERSFARFLDLRVGDVLETGGGVPLRVSAVVVVPKAEAYPRSQPGQAFATAETIGRIQPDRSQWASFLGVRLAEPEESGAFAARARAELPQAWAFDWHAERADAVEESKTIEVVLSIFGVLLLLAGGFVLATLIGGRVLAQVREIGVLKAAGLTPRQVAAIFVLEQLAVGLAGALAGLLLGTLATPLFVAQSASLLDASEIPPIDPARAALVLGVVLGAVAAFTSIPSWRTGLRTTGSILAGGRTVGVRRSRLARLPLPLSLGVGIRDALVRPGRALLTVLALALTVATVTATLGMEASFGVESLPEVGDPVDNEAAERAGLRPVVYGLDAVLMFVGLVNLLATILLGVRERVRELGLLKAVGMTPRQVASAYVLGQAVLAAAAVAVGIPLGLALFRFAIGATGGEDEFAYPPWWWLAILAPCAVAVVAAIGTPLAGRAARLPVADALRYE